MLSGSGDTVVALGASMSGKTFLIRELIKKKGQNFDTITIMSGTSFSHDWDELGISPVEVTIERIEAFIAMAREQISVTGQRGRHLLVIDDAMTAFPSTKNKTFTTLVTAGRHFGISTILLVQYQKFITPTIRSNTTGWFVMGKQLPMVVKGIHEITPYDAKKFAKAYSKLDKFDYVYIGPNAEVIFSRKVVKDGRELISPIPTDGERLRTALRSEAQVRERYQDREPVYEERPRELQSMQTTPGIYGGEVRRTSSEYTIPHAISSSSSSSSSSNSIPTYTTTERSEREITSPPQQHNGFFSGYFAGGRSGGGDSPEARVSGRESPPPTRSQIRSSYF